MSLFYFHRLLIVSAVVFDTFLSFKSFQMWQQNGEAINIVMGVGSSLLTAGLIWYFVYFNRHLAQHRRQMAGASGEGR